MLSLHTLAYILEQAGQYEEAEALFRERYELSVRSVGLENPATVNALNSVAYMLWRSGSYAKAEEAFREVVALGRRAYRTDHVVVGIGINNLAVAVRRRGGAALKEAEALQREAIAINRSAYGTEHPARRPTWTILAGSFSRRAEPQKRNGLTARRWPFDPGCSPRTTSKTPRACSDSAPPAPRQVT